MLPLSLLPLQLLLFSLARETVASLAFAAVLVTEAVATPAFVAVGRAVAVLPVVAAVGVDPLERCTPAERVVVGRH